MPAAIQYQQPKQLDHRRISKIINNLSLSYYLSRYDYVARARVGSHKSGIYILLYVCTNTLQLIFHLGNVGRQTDLQVVIYQNRLDRGTYLHYYCEIGKLSSICSIQNILIKGNDYIVSFEKLNEKIIATNDLLISSKIRLNQDKQCRCFSFDRGLFYKSIVLNCFCLFIQQLQFQKFIFCGSSQYHLNLSRGESKK